MLKWIGAACVVVGAGLSGMDIYIRQKKELAVTEAFLKTIIYMKDEMRYSKNLIETVFVKCAQINDVTQSFYENITAGLNEGKALNKLWNEEVEKFSELNSALKMELKELGEMIGTVELDMQDNLFMHTIEKIKKIKTEQESILHTKGKMYPKIGFGTGALLAVLLI